MNSPNTELLRVNTIKTLIQHNDKQYYIPSSCSFTQTNAWTTVDKRSLDSNNKMQSISVLQRNGKTPCTYSLSFIIDNKTPTYDTSYKSIYDSLYDYESLVGENISFIYSGYIFNDLLITDGTFALQNDSILGMTSISITYNIREATKNIQPKYNTKPVRTL